MGRMGELDLPDLLAPYAPRLLVMLGAGLACALVAIVLRAGLDALLPGGAPFPLVFPAALLATLFARWPAGAVTGATMIVHAWHHPFHAVALACAITVAIAELFRARCGARSPRATCSSRNSSIA